MAEDTPGHSQKAWKNMIAETPESPRLAAHRVAKERLPVVLRLLNYRIEGVMHVTENHRVLDMLNHPELFLPITEARVYNGATGALISETEFLAINKTQIVLLREDRARDDTPATLGGGDESPPGPLEEPVDGDLGSVRVSD